jgi:hypothetical protein
MVRRLVHFVDKRDREIGGRDPPADQQNLAHRNLLERGTATAGTPNRAS